MGQEYGFRTITTRYETSRLGNTTVDFETITKAGEKDKDDVFHDFTLDKQSGQETLLYTSAFPQGVSVEQVSEARYFRFCGRTKHKPN